MKYIFEPIKNEQNSPAYPYQQKINELKRKLRDTDYTAIKYAEGLISEEDYAPIKVERESYRVQIRECEAKIAELKANAST
jgi:hypothetical protein